MRNLRYVVFFLFVLACASNKNTVGNCETNAFEELDSLQASKVILNYKIALPKSWIKSSFSRGDWYFIEEAYIDSLGYQSTNADVYISKFPMRNTCDIKNYEVKYFLDFYVNYRSKWFRGQPFNYVLSKSEHSIYGDIYSIKYAWEGNKVVYVASAFLFMHDNTGYLIDYRNDENNFDKYLRDAEKIVESFRIEE